MDRAGEASQTSIGTRGRVGPVWLLGWTLATAVLLFEFGADALRQEFVDPDNAMWLVSVRDMLDGQGWWDNVQHRLNPPDGTTMHWARWLSVTIAAPIALLTPIVGSHAAEIITAFVWPLGCLAIFMMLVVRVCGELGAADGLRTEASFAGAIIAALAFPVAGKFLPGGFDHHGAELILSYVALLSLLKLASSPRSSGLVAGVALGLAIATAAESAPVVAFAIGAAGLLWLFRPETYARGLLWLGAGFAGSLTLAFVLFVPPQQWSKPVCDAMSGSFLGFGLAAGVVAILLARALPAAVGRTLGGRFAAAAVLSAVALAVLWYLFPDCAGGGYSTMSADMQTYWLAQIAEARTLAMLAVTAPTLILGVAGAAMAGLVAAAFYLRRRWRAPEGWIVLAFLLAGWALLTWQMRGGFFAAAFAVPFGAWAVVRSRQVWKSGAVRGSVLVFALAGVTSLSAAWSATGERLRVWTTPPAAMMDSDGREEAAKACVASSSYASLGAVPAGVMFNAFILGPSVLQRTRHAVTAAPYHRDVDGLMTMITAMRSEPDAARRLVERSSADYVLICPDLPEMQFYAQHPASGVSPDETLAQRLVTGDLPDWLEPVELSGSPLKLYRVVR